MMYLRIIECVVAILCGCKLLPFQSRFDTTPNIACDKGYDAITLRRIDLSQDYLLCSIISDFSHTYKQLNNDNKNAFYYLYMETIPNGYLVHLTLNTSDRIIGTDNLGYAIVDDNTVIISDTDAYNYSYTSSIEERTFKYQPDITGPYDPTEGMYLIKENHYGKNIYGIGWVIYLPDGLKLGPSDNVVTAPKRKHK